MYVNELNVSLLAVIPPIYLSTCLFSARQQFLGKLLQDPPNNFLFGKCFKGKLLNIYSIFFFFLQVQSFRLIMETNFIQMAASAGHAVAYTFGPIFKHIIDWMQLYITNGITNIVL